MKKEIYFCIDYNTYQYLCDTLDGSKWCSVDYDSTERVIGKVNRIVTTSLAHLTFYVINIGYDVYLCYEDKKVKIEEGMQLSDSGYCLSEPSYCDDADILEIFRSGYFDKMLGYNTGDIIDENGYSIELRDLQARFEKHINKKLL